MSKATSREESAEQARALEEIAWELYALVPDAFAAARDERARAARAAGKAQLARELSRLRRPTQSAWLINLVWREQQKLMLEFLALADAMSRAQAEASGPELQRLTGERRDQEAALLRAARALATAAGVSFSPSLEREVQETLSAALARPEVAAEVRAGRLVKAATYAGFGSLVPSTLAPGAGASVSTPVSKAAPGGAEHSSGQSTARVDLATRATTDDRAARAAARAREQRDEAEHAVQAARAALASAAADLAESTAAAETAQQQEQAFRQQVGELEQRLRELRGKLDEVQRQAVSAGAASLGAARRRLQAQQAHHAASRALAAAEQRLEQAAL